MHMEIKTRKSMENNEKILYRYVSPYCSDECVNNLINGKLQCKCAESGIYNWKWSINDNSCVLLSADNREITFHPVYSSGTAALRGAVPFEKNLHHFWEMKMLSNLYGTDVMVGIGTSKIMLTEWRYRFFSLLGCDKQSWGYSYNGLVQHNNIMRCYGSKFGLGSLIGVHLDMCSGTLEYYLNRKPLGIAFRGLKMHELYPMICSTAAQSTMKMTFATSIKSSLQFTCLQFIVKHPELYNQFKSVPGLARIYETKYFWMLPKEQGDAAKKIISNRRSLKRRKKGNSVNWPRHYRSQNEHKFPLHFIQSDSDSDSSSDINPSNWNGTAST